MVDTGGGGGRGGARGGAGEEGRVHLSVCARGAPIRPRRTRRASHRIASHRIRRAARRRAPRQSAIPRTTRALQQADPPGHVTVEPWRSLYETWIWRPRLARRGTHGPGLNIAHCPLEPESAMRDAAGDVARRCRCRCHVQPNAHPETREFNYRAGHDGFARALDAAAVALQPSTVGPRPAFIVGASLRPARQPSTRVGTPVSSVQSPATSHSPSTSSHPPIW